MSAGTAFAIPVDRGLYRVRRKATQRSSRQLRQRGKDARPGADALVKALQIVLLVRRMDVVVVEPEADQQRVDPEALLEVGDDRDRCAGADQERLPAPLIRQRALCGSER